MWFYWVWLCYVWLSTGSFSTSTALATDRTSDGLRLRSPLDSRGYGGGPPPIGRGRRRLTPARCELRVRTQQLWARAAARVELCVRAQRLRGVRLVSQCAAEAGARWRAPGGWRRLEYSLPEYGEGAKRRRQPRSGARSEHEQHSSRSAITSGGGGRGGGGGGGWGAGCGERRLFGK